MEIVANLLENAFRYSPAGSAIGLQLLENGLCVWDAGPAIPAEERDLIFQQGTRGSTAGSPREPVSGWRWPEHWPNATVAVWSCVQPRTIDPCLPEQGNAFRLSWPQPALPEATT